MPNDRLRNAMLASDQTYDSLAERLRVDPKTVERWVTQARVPYPRHRHTIARMLRQSETYLWPDAISNKRITERSQSEVITVYPRRSAVPDELWHRLIEHSTERIGILVYAGLFLVEQDPHLATTLMLKA